MEQKLSKQNLSYERYSAVFQKIVNLHLHRKKEDQSFLLSKEEYFTITRPLNIAARNCRVNPFNSYRVKSGSIENGYSLQFRYAKVILTQYAFGDITDFDINEQVLGPSLVVDLCRSVPRDGHPAQYAVKPYRYCVDFLLLSHWKSELQNHRIKFKNLYYAYARTLLECFGLEHHVSRGLPLAPTLIQNKMYHVYLQERMKIRSDDFLEHSKMAYINQNITINKEEIEPDPFAEKGHYSDEVLWLSATLFSLLKPLYIKFKISHPEFVLQLDNQSPWIAKKGYQPKFYEKIEAHLDRFCNYRRSEYMYPKVNYQQDSVPWEVCEPDLLAANGLLHLPKKEESIFRRTYHKWGVIASEEHLGFPLLFCNYERGRTHYLSLSATKRLGITQNTAITEEIEEESLAADVQIGNPKKMRVAKLQQLKTARCLPILFPVQAVYDAYPEEDCLTIPFSIAAINSRPIERFNVMPFYAGLMDFLCREYNQNPRSIRTLLNRCYKEALIDLHVVGRTPTLDEEHRACLLSSLYLALRIYPFSTHLDGIAFSPAYNLIRILKTKGTSSARTLSMFVKDAIRQDSKYHHVVFHQDEKGIYLHYKLYWSAYEAYCEKSNIFIDKNKHSFQRELYDMGYITPQYKPLAGKNIPWEYRKKVNDILAPVLNLTPSILEL